MCISGSYRDMALWVPSPRTGARFSRQRGDTAHLTLLRDVTLKTPEGWALENNTTFGI